MKTKVFALIISMIATLACQVFADVNGTFEINRNNIDIGTFYNGAVLKASGSVPDNSEVIVKFIGKSSELHMKEKGKAMGILWMNLNSILMKNVPEVFLVNYSTNFSVSPDKDQILATIGLASLKNTINVEADKTDKTLAVNELIKLKKSEGLYMEKAGNITYTPGTSGNKNFTTDIAIPSRLVPGDYSIEFSVIKNGMVVSKSLQPVSASFSGFPKLMSGIAFGNSLIYGILATVIAILSGFAIGMVFHSKGAH